MKKTWLFLVLTISFSLGFAFNSVITTSNKKSINMKRVTGIGGIFFKCKDP
ncbi:hypothetical protein [Niabella drilacis]|uniref:Uncharacterized protein n=1 Tax=Niabella drilacis (strain DSM 25811 / CCM 8410 / CCUG 62505 / LMG 26954 / E90) TaxID=1285928 RepID=A0A1G6LED5_NIADE|nr:hypothetical protein [Niabella drilacis]SDC41574.1 hypothetical protein SAMN04487894_102319 [Niabella drilacis]